jgi:hypothetical protein
VTDELTTADIERYFRITAGLDEWESFVKTPPVVTSGTLLGRDADAGFREVVDVAWHGVIAAVDHLLLIRDAGVEQVPARVLSVPTAARGALLSGCRTVWLLSSQSEQERRERAAGIALEDLEQKEGGVKAMRPFFPDDAEIEKQLRDVATARADLRKRCREAGLTPSKVGDTTMIAAAAEFLSRDVEEIHGALVISWRTLSGFAHGYRWTGTPAVAAPSVSDVVSAVAVGAIAANSAIRMFQEANQPAT